MSLLLVANNTSVEINPLLEATLNDILNKFTLEDLEFHIHLKRSSKLSQIHYPFTSEK